MYLQSLRVRRLGMHEIDLFQQAQSFLQGLDRRIRNHRLWTTRVTEDLRSGSKIVFGAFIDASDSPETFVGSVLVERGGPGVVHVSNLVVRLPPETMGNQVLVQHIGTIQRGLVNRVESFCRQRGFWQIDAEVFAYESPALPSQANSAINVLLEEGFSLQSIRSSSYFPQDCHYIFTKKLPFAFSGDPNDKSEISRWLLEDYFGFADIGQAQNVFFEDGEFCHCYMFEVPFAHNHYRIQGVCVVDIEQGRPDDIRNLALGQSKHYFDNPSLRKALAEANVRVLISFRRDAPASSDPRLWSLNVHQISEILGPAQIGQPSGEELGGLVIELREDRLQDRLREAKPFGYYVASGLGTEIFDEFYDSSSERRRQFFALLASHERGGPVVWGVARLDKIESFTSFTAFTGLPSPLRLWDLAHFEYYVNDFSSSYKEQETTYVLTMGHPVKFGRPFKLEHVLGGDASQRFAELEVTTKYVSVSLIDELKLKEGEAFELACQDEALGALHQAPEVQNVSSRLATYLRVQTRHRPHWFCKHDDVLINRLEKSLVGTHREQALPQMDDDLSRTTQGRVRSPHPTLFHDEQPIESSLAQAEKAWVEFTRQRQGACDGVVAWRLRLASRNLLEATRSDLRLKRNIYERLREVFPTVGELRRKAKRELEDRIPTLFPEDADANSRSVSRRSIIERVLELDPDRLRVAVMVPDARSFAAELMDKLFAEPGYDHLVRLAETLERHALDEGEKTARADIRDAMIALRQFESM